MAAPEQIITSACGEYRAEVVRLPTGGFVVTMFRWREEWVPDYGKAGEFWERVSRSVTIADTLKRAAELAEEEFRSLGTTGPAPVDEDEG
ncbi:MAG: hypothetical protein J0I06_24345 [Planctomycetes bacterium]|nr:hypothetical protein [Planctomycetota bacterium]